MQALSAATVRMVWLSLLLRITVLSTSCVAQTATAQPLQPQRHLQTGTEPFASLNALLQDVQWDLPNTTVTDRVALIRLRLTLENVYCTDVSIGDLEWQTLTDTNQEHSIQLTATGVNLNCVASHDWKYGLVGGGGSLQAYTQNNFLQANVTFASANLDVLGPTSVRFDGCNSNLNIYDIDVQGKLADDILNAFEKLMRNAIEELVEDVLCDELRKLVEEQGNGFLQQAREVLAVETSASVSLLAAEQSLVAATPAVQLLDYKALDDSVGPWLVDVIQEAQEALLQVDADTGSLAVNALLRENFLDAETGALTLSNLDQLLLDRHDRLTETKIVWQGLTIVGLDTITSFRPLVAIGSHTLQTQLQWEALEFQIQLQVRMQPSTLPDSLVLNPNPDTTIVEDIVVTVGLRKFGFLVAVLLALDQTQLGDLELGSLLESSHLLSCFLSVVHRLQLAGLQVTIDSIDDPTLQGFVSPGIDRIVSSMVETAFSLYEPMMLRAAPGLVQEFAVDWINDFLDELGQDSVCPLVEARDQPLDFRDLLLEPDEARVLGGSGTRPYGDLGPLLYGLVQDRLLTPLIDGQIPFTENLVKPLTKNQSGEEGTIRLETLVSWIFESIATEAVIREFVLRLDDLRIDNLDAINPPLKLLYPSAKPQVVENVISLGTAVNPLQASVDLFLSLDSSAEPLSLNDALTLSASLDQSTIEADLMVMMAEANLLQFPMRDVLSWECWLATLVDDDSSGATLDRLAILLSTLRLDMSCSNCTSPGFELLPGIMGVYEESGATDMVASKVEEMVDGIARSSLVSSFLDEAVASANEACASSKDTSPPQRRLQGGSLPANVVDTVVFASMLLVEAGFVIVAENHRQRYFESLETLEDYTSRLGDLSNYVDWSNIGTSLGVGEIADTLFNQARQYVNGMDDNGQMRINELVRDNLMDNGSLVLATGLDVEVGDMTLSISSVRVDGLDSFSSVDLLIAESPTVLRNTAQMADLSLTVTLSVDSPSSTPPTQEFTLSFAVADVSIDVSLLAAMDIQLLEQLTLGSFFDMANILPCILTSAPSLAIPELVVSVRSFSKPRLEGLLPDTSAALTDATNLLFESYSGIIEAAIPTIFDSSVKHFANEFLASVADGAFCPKGNSNMTGSVDFRDLLLTPEEAKSRGGSGLAQYGELFRFAAELLQTEFFDVEPNTRVSKMNKALVAPLTEAQSSVPGMFSLEGDVFGGGTTIDVGGLQAVVDLKVYDAYLKDLDTIGQPLSLLDPVDRSGYEVDNMATFGLGRPVELGVHLFILIAGDDSTIQNDLKITLQMDSISVAATLLAKIAEERLFNFPINDILNWRCWLATIPASPLDKSGARVEGSEANMALANLAAEVANLNLNITCIQCSSPGMEDLAVLLSTPEAQDEVTVVANDLFQSLSNFLAGDFTQVRLDRLVYNAAAQCPHRQEYDAQFQAAAYESFPTITNTDDISFLILLAGVSVGFGVFVLLSVLFVKFVTRRRHRVFLQHISDNRANTLYADQQMTAAREKEVNETTTSMFRSPSVPRYLRYGMPLIILANIGFFLSGHLSLGASVNIEAILGGQSFRVENFFEFSMMKSTVEIWNAGGKELAIMILIFSGLWPYTKQIVTFFLWFAPPSRVAVAKRGSIFLWLDALAKWSMVDIFVLVVTVAGFRVSVQSPDVAFLPPGFYSLDLLVIPKWGLYANFMAQLISQISSHFIVHYHRRIVEQAEKTFDEKHADKNHSFADDTEVATTANPQAEPDAPRERLSSHEFGRPHRGDADTLVVRKGTDALLVFTAFTLSILAIVGCVLPAFSLETLGIIGVMVESGQRFAEAQSEHSLFTMIQLLFDQAKFTGEISDLVGLGSLSALLVFSVLIVPILQSAALLYQWLAPMNRVRRNRILVLVETLQAWQYAEVFLLSVVIASWQLGPVSDFMVNDYCGALDGFFASMVYYGVLKKADAQCFRVETAVEEASYLLAVAAILLAFLNTFVNKAALQYFRDQGQRKNPTSSVTCPDRAEIVPVAVLFSDRFRWFLQSSTAARPGESKLGLPEPFPASPTVALNTSMSRWQPAPVDPRVDPGEVALSRQQSPRGVEELSSFDEEDDCEELESKG